MSPRVRYPTLGGRRGAVCRDGAVRIAETSTFAGDHGRRAQRGSRSGSGDYPATAGAINFRRGGTIRLGGLPVAVVSRGEIRQGDGRKKP